MNFNQFVPLSILCSDFPEIERLLGLYGEVVIVKDDRPKYRLVAIDVTEDIMPNQLPNSSHKVMSKGDETMEILNKIGKSTFIEHYYDFKFDRIPADELPEEFTSNSKRSRTSKARRIFRDGLHLEALQIIINSNRLDQEIIDRAKEIYEKEISQS